MRKITCTLGAAAIVVAATAAATTLRAADEPSGASMRHEGHMMGVGGIGMMGGMRRMMGGCGAMMRDGRGGDRPNDQWRRRAPGAPKDND